MKQNLQILSYIFIGLLLLSTPAYTEETKAKPEKKTFVLGDNRMPAHIPGIKQPEKFLRSIYLHSTNGSRLSYIKKIIPKAKEANINCFVIDVAPYKSMSPRINPEVVQELLANDIFPIARIVTFQYGLENTTVPQAHLDKVNHLVDSALKAGFKEIQLDYIRYADNYYGMPLKKKYAFISSLLGTVRERITDPAIFLSTDVFGRIVYNKDDVIGQKLESMAEHAQVICPMVYPSHYYPDRFKLRNPYFTVRQSTLKGLNRIGTKTYIMPYIQAFRMNLSYTRMTLPQYMEAQVQAVEDTAARGWIFWSANNKYEPVFKMLKEFYAKNPQNLGNNPSGYNTATGEIKAEAEERGKKSAER